MLGIKQSLIFKILVLGSSGVGKTSLIEKYVGEKQFKDTSSEIGVNFSLKNIVLPNNKLPLRALQIWDVIGSYKFKSVIPFYVQATQGIILAFSGENIETLFQLNDYLKIVYQILPKMVPTILIATKSDRYPVDYENQHIQSFLAQNNIKHFMKTSVIKKENIGEVFHLLTDLILADLGYI